MKGKLMALLKPNLEIDHNISTIEESFRNIRIKKREQKIKAINKDKNKKIEKLDERKNFEQSTQIENTPIVKKSKEQSQLEYSKVLEQRTEGIHKEMTTVAALKECNICHKENDNLKETKRSIKEWYKMTHDIKLLKVDIEDQAMLGE